MCFCGNLFCRQTQVYGIHRRVRYKKMRWRVQLSTSRSDLPPTATGRVWIRRHRRYMGVRIGMNSLLWRIGVFGPSRRMRITRCLCKRSFSIDGERQGPDRDVAFPTFKFSILNKWDRRKYFFLIRRRCRLRAVSWMGKVWQPWQRSVHDTGTNHFQFFFPFLTRTLISQVLPWCCWRSHLLSPALQLQEGSSSVPELSKELFAHPSRISLGHPILWGNHHAMLQRSWTLRVI